jgi:hypothetical protein
MIKITIKTENVAFQGLGINEILRILKDYADNLKKLNAKTSILDINGNSVCKIEYTGKDKILIILKDYADNLKN